MRHIDNEATASQTATVENGLSRRDFLVKGGAIVGGLAAAGAVIAVVGRDSNNLPSSQKATNTSSSETTLPLPGESKYHSADKVKYPDQLSKLVAEGMEEKWHTMAVFPGMLMASPGAKFYQDIALSQEVDMGLTGDNRALILRPVFPDETLSVGSGVNYEGQDKVATQAGGIDPDTFAFISPVNGGVLFGNYSQSVEQLNVLSRLHGDDLAYTANTNSNLPIQFVDIAVRKSDQGVVVPAGVHDKEDERVYPEPTGDPLVDNKPIGTREVTNYFAVGQGRVYGSANEVNQLIYNFMGGSLSPVVVEPGYGPTQPVN